VVSKFIGRYEHSLDTKGRIVIPARFRTSFETSAYLSQFDDGCVALWTPVEFDKQLASMEARQERSPGDRNLTRIWAGGSVEVEIDRQGRFAIPTWLRAFAHLETAVLVMGALDRVELWNPDEWEARIRPAEQTLLHPPERAAVV
jgi:MraZ protein